MRKFRIPIIVLLVITRIEVLQGQHTTHASSDNSVTIELDGSRLTYRIEGHGTPCLVIGSSVYYPRTFSDNIRRYLKLYFVDMKWFAKDYKAEALHKVTIKSIVNDVEQIR